MKRYLGSTAVALLITAVAHADTRVHITGHSDYRNGPGGEFTMQPLDDLIGKVKTGLPSDRSPSTWQTFCLEFNEYFNLNHTYYADINTEALNGGVDTDDGDPLSAHVAYLYSSFRHQTLDTTYAYAPGATRAVSSTQLQRAIWALEGEAPGSLSATTQSLIQEAVDATAMPMTVAGMGLVTPNSTTSVYGIWGDKLGDVRVLNLWGDAGRTQFKQDQLVIIPAPGAALLAMCGLGLVGRIRSRRTIA